MSDETGTAVEETEAEVVAEVDEAREAMVASIADEWDDRLKQMFGGATYQEVLAEKRIESLSMAKPGEGGGPGLYL